MRLAVLTEVPVELGRDQARELAREELARQIYREAGPGLTERVLRWLFERATGLLDDLAEVSPGGYAGLAVVVLLLVAAAIAIRMKVGPLGRAVSREEPLFVGGARGAAEHRRLAERHAAAGEWAEAVRERLRAVVRELEERALLEPRPGRTADEAAAEGGLALPTVAADLRAAARVFDEIWYGGRAAGPDAARRLRSLDDAVRAARPVGQPAGPAS